MRVLLSILLFAIPGIASHAQPSDASAVFSSGERQTALVELFTSEGCSSCPPADRWLSGLKTDGGLWQDYVPVAFHVDYWNYLGWTDRFANSGYSDRQRRYAAEGGVRTVYTPGMFLNGREWRGWRRIDAPDFSGGARPGVLRLELRDRHLDVDFDARDPSATDGLSVTVALLGMSLESTVEAGENRGRRLHHDFVVLGTGQQHLEPGARRFTARLALPNPVASAPAYAIAAWVTAEGSQAPLQTVGGFLPSASVSVDTRPGRR